MLQTRTWKYNFERETIQDSHLEDDGPLFEMFQRNETYRIQEGLEFPSVESPTFEKPTGSKSRVHRCARNQTPCLEFVEEYFQRLTYFVKRKSPSFYKTILKWFLDKESFVQSNYFQQVSFQ